MACSFYDLEQKLLSVADLDAKGYFKPEYKDDDGLICFPYQFSKIAGWHKAFRAKFAELYVADRIAYKKKGWDYMAPCCGAVMWESPDKDKMFHPPECLFRPKIHRALPDEWFSENGFFPEIETEAERKREAETSLETEQYKLGTRMMRILTRIGEGKDLPDDFVAALSQAALSFQSGASKDAAKNSAYSKLDFLAAALRMVPKSDASKPPRKKK